MNHVKHSNRIILKIFEDSCSIPAPSPLPSLHLFQLNPSHSLRFFSFWFSLVALLWLGCSLSGLSSRYQERKIAFQVYQEMSAVLSVCTSISGGEGLGLLVSFVLSVLSCHVVPIHWAACVSIQQGYHGLKISPETNLEKHR